MDRPRYDTCLCGCRVRNGNYRELPAHPRRDTIPIPSPYRVPCACPAHVVEAAEYEESAE